MNAHSNIEAGAPLISAPGCYDGIPAESYHRNPNLLPGPSLSSSGAKTLLEKSPLHFHYDSILNPDRPEETGETHFSVGKAAHDMLLLSDRWGEFYHVLPEGFAWNKTKMMPDAIAEAEAAREAGKVILRDVDVNIVAEVAKSLGSNKLAVACLTNGKAEQTIVWKDALTGVWLRCRPDFLPNKRRIIPDLKFMSPTYSSPRGFGRAIDSFGYHIAAAIYSDGIKAVFGEAPANWLHVVVEKEAPYCVSLYELPADDIARGRVLARKAINMFAECLNAGHWPGYANDPIQVGLPGYARKLIDEMEN